MTNIPKHIIQTSSLLRNIVTVTVLCLIIAALSYFCWQLLEQQATHDERLEATQLEQQRQSQEQADIIGSQQKELSETTSAARQKSQALVIEESTNVQLEKQLSQLQEQVLNLEKELSFYQTVTQGPKTSGLQIHEFQLFVDDSTQPNNLRYRLMLTQGQRIEAPLEGQVMLQLPSSGNDASPVILDTIDFKLRYVQIIEGFFTITTNAPPEKIVVILSQGDKPNRLQSFDWKLSPTQRE